MSDLQVRIDSQGDRHELHLAGRIARVESFFAPYVCAACGHEASMALDVAAHEAELRRGQVPPATCPECRGATELAELPERYLVFLEP